MFPTLPEYLNNVSTRPCETRNAHRTRTTIEFLDREHSRIYPSSTGASKFARFASS